MNESTNTLKTVQEVEQYAAQLGIVLSEADRKRIAAAQEAELDRLKTVYQTDKGNDWIERWNEYYPKFLEAIIGVGATVMTFSQTVIVSLGVPIVLILLLIVEHRRVYHGIGLFEVETALASFAGWALVLLNLVLEFQVHYIEHRAGYEAERAQRWSLRLWLENMAYRLGIGKHWQSQALSPAQRYRELLRLVTFTILALALAGSMRGIIEAQPGAWHEAIIAIVTQSSLLQIITWIGGLLFAFAAVLSAQGLSRYVAIRCVEILGNMEARQQASQQPHLAAIQEAGASAALAIVTAKIKRQEAKEQAQQAKPENFMMSVPEVVIQSNGNGRH